MSPCIFHVKWRYHNFPDLWLIAHSPDNVIDVLSSTTNKYDNAYKCRVTNTNVQYSLRTVSCGSLTNDEDNLRDKCPCRADLANSRIEYMVRSPVSSARSRIIGRLPVAGRSSSLASDITLTRWRSSNTSCDSRLSRETSALNRSHTGRNAYLSRSNIRGR